MRSISNDISNQIAELQEAIKAFQAGLVETCLGMPYRDAVRKLLYLRNRQIHLNKLKGKKNA